MSGNGDNRLKGSAGFMRIIVLLFVVVFLFSACEAEDNPSDKQGNVTTSVVYNTNYAASSYDYSLIYNYLTEPEKQIYREIYSGLKTKATSINITAILEPEDFEKVYKLVTIQEPEFYDVGETMEYSVLQRTGCVNACYVSYTKDEQARYIADICIESGVNNVLESIGRITDKRVMIRKIHNYIITSTVYDEGALEPNNIYGVFVDGRATCAGYAKSFKFLCDRCNIPCIVVTGVANGSHMWNYVKLNDIWYAVDTTWDDPDSTEDDNLIYNDYCVVDIAKIAETHIVDEIYEQFGE